MRNGREQSPIDKYSAEEWQVREQSLEDCVARILELPGCRSPTERNPLVDLARAEGLDLVEGRTAWQDQWRDLGFSPHDLAVAVVLLQITRRVHLPYPGILAAAGVAVAMIPGAPNIPIDPHTALALFIAPVLIDSAYDFPLGAARRMLLPIFVYAVVAVLATTGVVVAISALTVGLPVAVALTLGAIVAPPDAAAATAVLSGLPVDRRVDTLLKGESLFNDATALLLFSAALSVQASGGLTSATIITIAFAAPGGILFGIAFGYLLSKIRPLTENTVGGTLLQFVYAFATWIIAERLHLSAVLATVSSAMTIATLATINDSPRMRVHSFAVWTTVVFLLNVVAFLLMGLQAKSIVEAMSAGELARAVGFATIIVVGVIVCRIAIAFLFHAVVTYRHDRGSYLAPFRHGETMLVGPGCAALSHWRQPSHSQLISPKGIS
nr:cation:proton antiporter [Rhizobium leguminosarum]